MKTTLIAQSSIVINAPATKVWDALVNPKSYAQRPIVS